MIFERWSDAMSIAVIALGGVGVSTSYAYVFTGENSSYTNSRFWAGIPPSTARVLIPLQVLAAMGFLAFAWHVTGLSTRKSPRTGILSYSDGYMGTLILAMFFGASIAWPFTTRSYLNMKEFGNADLPHLIAVVIPLVIAAVSSTLLTAGAFEADMHPIAIIGVLLFSMVVVLVDGVGWNSKLILNHSQ